MIDERIHIHCWENGHCKTCGVKNEPTENGPIPPAEMRGRLSDIHKRLEKTEEIIKGRTNVLLFLVIVILLFGC